MIKFFRQSYAVQYVVIALLAIALWIPAFVSGKASVGLDSSVTPIFNLFERLLSFSPFAQCILAFALVLLEALVFNSILVENQIIGKVSTLGAFVFELLMSLTQTQTAFYPFALSVIFILLLLRVLFDLYLSQNAELSLLKAGIYVALASMCYFPSILLIIWVMVVLPVAKKSSLRLQLIPLMGLVFIYFFYFAGQYLFGDFLPVIQGYGAYFASFRISFDGFNLKNIILLAFLLVSSLLLFFANGNYEKTISVRVKMTMSVLLLVLAVMMLFVGGDVLMNGLIFIALSVFFSYEFTAMNNTGWANLVLVAFLLLVFANHYYFKLL